MTAPVPLTLDELLHAVVEACVQEITAARREVAMLEAELCRKGDEALKVTLPNGIEVQTETTAEADALLDWLMAAPELITATGTKRGPYSKHNLGPVQAKIVEALAAGPMQHRELAELTGAADRNLRYTLVSMVGRGTIVRGWNQLRQVVVFALPGVELPPVPEDRPHKGVPASEVTKAAKVGSGSEKREPSLHLSPPRVAVEKSAAIPARTPAPRAPTVERSADASSPAPVQREAVGASTSAPRTGRPGLDLTGVKVGNFVGIERTRGRIAGAVVWLFRCELCGAERGWTNSHVQATKRARVPGRCSCQGGPKPIQAPILRAAPAYKPQTNGLETAEQLDENPSELDVGDDVGDLLSRAMAEAEGDGRIRSIAARASRPRRPDDDQEDEDGSSSEGEKSEPDDEDAEDDGVEELDFE